MATLRPHPTIEHLYVSDVGIFFKMLPLSVGYGGYTYVHVDGKFAVRRHTLILEIYKGARPEGAVARHLNGDPQDDDPENLTWGTQQENCQDTVRHGRSTTGEKNAQAKLTAAKVVEIKARFNSGESGSAIAEDFGVSHSTICDIMAGRTWKHVQADKFGLPWGE